MQTQGFKKNAKEYLKEFATSQSDWLKALIYEVIETNGNISNDKKKKIFDSLKDDTALAIDEPNISAVTLLLNLIVWFCFKALTPCICSSDIRRISLSEVLALILGSSIAKAVSSFKLSKIFFFLSLEILPFSMQLSN
jgi:hypothetical protein